MYLPVLRRDGSGSDGRTTFLCPLKKIVTGDRIRAHLNLPLYEACREDTYLPRNWTMPVNRFGKSRLESWENTEATSMQGIQNSGARNSAGLRRSAAGVTLLWRYQRWYLDRRTWIWTPYDLASGLLDVDYQTNLSYPLAHVYCPSQLTLMIDSGPLLKWRRRNTSFRIRSLHLGVLFTSIWTRDLKNRRHLETAPMGPSDSSRLPIRVSYAQHRKRLLVRDDSDMRSGRILIVLKLQTPNSSSMTDSRNVIVLLEQM